jgi:two-component system chemotaxis response regulator CheB
MPGHDIIVIGSSAGGLKALTAVVGGLPADLDAALFVVQHVSPEHRSLLPEILSDIGMLPAIHPRNGETISKRLIYIAPPDRHMLLERDRVRVVRGPQENRFRPAVDTLFRSAARTYGPRVIGVVLTGYLDDGTVGLQAIKRRGGITVVQDPDEAEYPSMPASALRYATIDYCVPLADLPLLMTRLVKEPAPAEQTIEVPKELEIETNIIEQQMNTQQLIASIEAIGTRTYFTCPTCNGSLWQIGNDEPLRFRCHIGHSFTVNALMADQTRSLENALSSAVRLMEEKVMISRRMAERRRAMNLMEAAEPYEQYAAHLEHEVSAIRQLLMSGDATRYIFPGEEANQEKGEQ